jgi:tricarballylate dehydrogenase
MSTIRLRNLTKEFGDLVAVDHIDLDVEAGEVLCLLGPSGCGKTTALRMIAGLERVTAGEVLIAEQRVNALSTAERDIAMVFQFYALYPSLTVAENLAFPLHADPLSETEIETTDFGTYTSDQFFDDIFRVTQYRCDPDKAEALVTRSLDTLIWMREKGIGFIPIYGRQAFKIDGKFKFWGGLTVETRGGGPGLYDMQMEICAREGIEVKYETRAVDLLGDSTGITGVRVKHGGETRDISAKAVIIASGGFQSNPEWRTRYLGPGWDLAKVRGTRFNSGEGIRMAIDIGAATAGNWSGGHAVGWDRNAPEFGDLAVGDQFQKHSYPFFIMVNANGERFVDEGADFRNYTYAKYGREIDRKSVV